MSDPQLRAVVFDVDGTLVDSERHGHRVAFNRAFEEFGLPHRWDEDLYGELLHTTGGQRRIDGYLATQGVPEAERAELAPALHRRKTEILEQMVDDGAIELRPGAASLLEELAGEGVALAVGTTGSRRWVERLLKRLLPSVGWDVIVAGDDVTNRKPDPEVFTTALKKLGLDRPEEVVVIEDSGEGVAAARAAGTPCVVVVNGYTADHDLDGADLVLDGFGEPDAPATVLADPHALGLDGILDAALLRKVLQCRG
ncbi:MAG TPA: HAD-IA family hydrolase [Acidimicrobiales bacterium]|nr:HAD-IA family hydrolase [Acidimicrobiales bacterium]